MHIFERGEMNGQGGRKVVSLSDTYSDGLVNGISSLKHSRDSRLAGEIHQEHALSAVRKKMRLLRCVAPTSHRRSGDSLRVSQHTVLPSVPSRSQILGTSFPLGNGHRESFCQRHISVRPFSHNDPFGERNPLLGWACIL